MRVDYAIVFVKDMERSVAFYRDTLELTLRFESPQWTEFEGGGATLALHAADTAGPDVRGPQDGSPGSCRPGFSVADLDALHDRMLEREVRCVQEPKEVFGARLAQYADPDGLVISVGEERRAG